MRLKQYIIMFTVLVSVFGTMTGITSGAPKTEEKKNWAIPFLGTLQVPAQLEVIDGKDVIGEILTLAEKETKSHPTTNTSSIVQKLSPEDIAQAFTNYNIGVYQLALKNNGSYNIAVVFAGKLPENYTANGLAFFDNLKNTTPQKQEEIHHLILSGISDLYTKKPDLQNTFQLEILEFYPIEQMNNKNAQIISLGGSVAVRTFKLIQPFALKTYIINKNSELYLLAVLTSGPDRKLWNDMTKEMLLTASWSLL